MYAAPSPAMRAENVVLSFVCTVSFLPKLVT